MGVVPLLLTSFHLVARSRDILELDQKAIQLDKARSLSQQVAIYIGSLKGQIAVVAHTLEADMTADQFAARVARFRESKALEALLGGESWFYSISIVDAKGSGARSGAQLPEPAIDTLLQEGYSRGLEGKSMLSPPLFSRELKEPVAVISEPLRSGEQVLGVILAVASLGPLWEATRQLAAEGAIEVYIVDSRGRMIAHSNPGRIKGDLDMSQVEIVRQFLDAKGLAAATVPFTLQGRRMLGTYTAVPNDLGWGVIAQVDEAQAYFEAAQMRQQSLGLAGLVAVAAVVLGMLVASQITRPIRELALGAHRLAGGEYGYRVSTRSRNEVGYLAERFNDMGAEIEKAIAEIRKQAEINKELFMGSIKMLANAIDEKDVYTRGHSERVAYYAMMMAKHLGMPHDEVERVYLSGLIHDVGKIGIEDRILRKPAALTDDEYEIMKQHPRKGEKILEAVPKLKQMAGAGLMHHENVDGSGYPDGLKGDSIPLLGRIVSVADAFDAMTTDRPYSKAMTFEASLARLQQLSGRKFDAGCVAAMEKALKSGDLSPQKARLAAVQARRQSPAAPPA